MPSFNTEVPHSLGRDEAREKLKNFLDNVAKLYKDQVSNLEGNWNENELNFSFTSYGFAIKGDLTVEEDKARIKGQLPFAAAPFRGKIEQSIAGELKKALS